MQRCIFGVLVVVGLVAGGRTIAASDQMGVYCIVDRVVLEPTTSAVRAQIWGTCAAANPNTGQFHAASRGYFYFSIPAGQDKTVRAEWLDLQEVAATGEAVGFGARHQAIGRFRPATEKLAAPDPYPLNVGVVKLKGRVSVGPSVSPDPLSTLESELRKVGSAK